MDGRTSADSTRSRWPGGRLPRVLPRLTLAVCAATLLLGGCAEEIPPPDADQPPPAAVETVVAGGVPEPAVLALPYVPADAARLEVTDFARVAVQLGVEDPTSQDPAADRAAFERRTTAETAALTDGTLLPVDEQLVQRFGFGQADVTWEAHVFAEDGTETGFVLGIDRVVDPEALTRAVEAGLGPLAGASVVAEDSVIVQGLDASGGSYADDPAVVALVGAPAISTYLARGCLDPDGADVSGLDDLQVWAMSFQGGLATATLGPDRADLFDRLEVAEASTSFARSFTDGVADPSTGRIGFRLSDPPAAADLVASRDVPVAYCD